MWGIRTGIAEPDALSRGNLHMLLTTSLALSFAT